MLLEVTVTIDTPTEGNVYWDYSDKRHSTEGYVS